MKSPRVLLWLTVLLLALAPGCASVSGGNDAALIQRLLDRALPANFTGDASFEHKNSYLDFQISARNLRRVDNQWKWDSLSYRRNGRFSHGVITLGANVAR